MNSSKLKNTYMSCKEHLRIRSPVHQEEGLIDIKQNADAVINTIPTYILIINLVNSGLYVYNGDTIHLYFAIITGVMWIGVLLDAVYNPTPHLPKPVDSEPDV